MEDQPYEWKLLLDIAYAALDDVRQEEEARREREREKREMDMASGGEGFDLGEVG